MNELERFKDTAENVASITNGHKLSRWEKLDADSIMCHCSICGHLLFVDPTNKGNEITGDAYLLTCKGPEIVLEVSIWGEVDIIRKPDNLKLTIIRSEGKYSINFEEELYK